MHSKALNYLHELNIGLCDRMDAQFSTLILCVLVEIGTLITEYENSN